MIGPEGAFVAYVFVNDAHPADFERIFALPAEDPARVHSAVRLMGTWDAMVVLTVSKLSDIEELVTMKVRGGHSPVTQTALAMGTIAPPGLVTWTTSPPVIAFSRIRVRRGTARDVMAAVASHRMALGVVAVAGAFDILAEFGGETFEEVSEVLIDFLPSIDGVLTADTGFSTRLVHGGT